MRIVIGSDDAGFTYKELLKLDLLADTRVEKIIDVGVSEVDHTAYPHIAIEAARMITANMADRGLLVCGTGMGMAMAANKVPGIRASVAHDSFSVERLIRSNDAHILTLGARVIGPELAKKLVHEWLGYSFDENSPSAKKVALFTNYENNYARSE